METIKNYLDNILPICQNKGNGTAKSEIYYNMEEKYNELKKSGKPENEAIGIVISEFGNIDELLEEMGISRHQTVKTIP